MMKRKKNQPRFLEAFSPTIMESTVPKRFVDIVNEVGDTVLSDDVKSAKWDWSHKLVGKVSKEVQIPISNSDDREFLFRIMRQGCLDYLKYIISKNRAYKWNESRWCWCKTDTRQHSPDAQLDCQSICWRV